MDRWLYFKIEIIFNICLIHLWVLANSSHKFILPDLGEQTNVLHIITKSHGLILKLMPRYPWIVLRCTRIIFIRRFLNSVMLAVRRTDADTFQLVPYAATFSSFAAFLLRLLLSQNILILFFFVSLISLIMTTLWTFQLFGSLSNSQEDKWAWSKTRKKKKTNGLSCV